MSNSLPLSPLSAPVMPAEWERQDAIILAWPHSGTDWAPMLHEAQACFSRVAQAIVSEMALIVITPEVEEVRRQLAHIDNHDRIIYQSIATNDTWARDFGPISVVDQGRRILLDFKFNAWGMKFASNYDNLICREMASNGIFSAPLINCQDFVLEGGSIESDGIGTILTTTTCLLSHNRNDSLDKKHIEDVLCQRLGAKKVLWLEHGYLEGDDTDSHIDTLARLAPGNTILYVQSRGTRDEQDLSLKLMEQELKAMTNASGDAFNLVPLPCPEPIVDEAGERLPATYANFLITNTQVLVPVYNQPSNDARALEAIAQVFPGRRVAGIDCNALIQQHGSLHCITMQIPHNFLNI